MSISLLDQLYLMMVLFAIIILFSVKLIVHKNEAERYWRDQGYIDIKEWKVR